MSNIRTLPYQILSYITGNFTQRVRNARHNRKLIRNLEQKHGEIVYMTSGILLDYYITNRMEGKSEQLSYHIQIGGFNYVNNGDTVFIVVEIATNKGIAKLKIDEELVELYLKGESRYVDIYVFKKHPKYYFIKERSEPIPDADYIDNLPDVVDYYRSLGGGLTRYEDFIYMNRLKREVIEFESELDERMKKLGMGGGEIYDGYEEHIGK